ncbi:hypothetical protein [Sphingorhabdus sp.]|jgi:hypothetical protein|uniref:hypothetical protein n=1 Tax=Sphingorhabdus sp. TaxID=1902408 RepID=UPI0037CAC3FB
MEWKSIGRWCWRNLGNFALIGGWLVSAGFFPFLLTTAQGVTPLGYGIASVAGLLSFAVGRAFWMAARNWKLDAKIKDRLSSDSSPFDPMATVFENKRIFLKDLAPAGRRFVLKKKFINCEIIGPGNIVVALGHKLIKWVFKSAGI